MHCSCWQWSARLLHTAAGKWNAVVKEVKRMHKVGRPVLVGTTSVEQSEALAEQLGGEGGLLLGTCACINCLFDHLVC